MTITVPPLPKLIAHRGESGLAPENTLAAISLAADNGATWAEIDVNVSSDGIAYVHHDDGLKRCTNGKGYLINTPSSTLDSLDAGSWFSADFAREPLPRFDAVIALLQKRQMGLNLEIKPTAGWEIPCSDAICDQLEKHWPEGLPLLISSFSTLALMRARERLSSVPMGMLWCAIPSNWEQLMDSMNCQTLHCAADFVTQEKAAQIKQSGYPLLCYTVNEQSEADRLFSLGVDSVFTDYPSRLKSP